MGKFIIKHIDNRKPQIKIYKSEVKEPIKENKAKTNNKQVMTTSEKVEMAKNVLNNQAEQPINVKRVRKDKGLIERTESSKTILTEDNKELLND